MYSVTSNVRYSSGGVWNWAWATVDRPPHAPGRLVLTSYGHRWPGFSRINVHEDYITTAIRDYDTTTTKNWHVIFSLASNRVEWKQARAIRRSRIVVVSQSNRNCNHGLTCKVEISPHQSRASAVDNHWDDGPLHRNVSGRARHSRRADGRFTKLTTTRGLYGDKITCWTESIATDEHHL